MGWFQDLCHSVGVTVHNVISAFNEGRAEDSQPKQVDRRETVEEEDQGDIILRRTTIEEIEIKHNPNKDQ